MSSGLPDEVGFEVADADAASVLPLRSTVGSWGPFGLTAVEGVSRAPGRRSGAGTSRVSRGSPSGAAEGVGRVLVGGATLGLSVTSWSELEGVAWEA
jgi:hypothetical protein